MNIIGIRGSRATIVAKDESEKDYIIAAIKKVGRHRSRIHTLDGTYFLTVSLDLAVCLYNLSKRGLLCE